MAQEKAEKDVFKTNLRLPRKLEAAIKKATKVTKRSFNAEVEFTLTERYLR